MPALEISTQESRPFWKLATRPARRLRPDVLVRLRSNHEVALIADTKWKLLREGIPNDEDLRQMFVYNEVFGANRAVLIYPSVAEPSLAEGRYLLRSHSCGTLQLGLFDGAEWSGKWLQQQLELLLSGIESDNSKSDAR